MSKLFDAFRNIILGYKPKIVKTTSSATKNTHITTPLDIIAKNNGNSEEIVNKLKQSFFIDLKLEGMSVLNKSKEDTVSYIINNSNIMLNTSISNFLLKEIIKNKTKTPFAIYIQNSIDNELLPVTSSLNDKLNSFVIIDPAKLDIDYENCEEILEEIYRYEDIPEERKQKINQMRDLISNGLVKAEEVSNIIDSIQHITQVAAQTLVKTGGYNNISYQEGPSDNLIDPKKESAKKQIETPANAADAAKRM